MKKKTWVLILTVVIVMVGLYFYWPRSLDKVLEGEGRLSIMTYDLASSNVLVYELDSKDEAFAEISKLFEGYHCNIDLQSLIPGQRTDGESIRMTFINLKDKGATNTRMITVRASGYIEIDGEEFRCKKAEKLLMEIREVLKDVEPEE